MMKVGIVGAGVIGTRRATAIGSIHQDNKIIAVCDIDFPRAEELASKYGADSCQDWREIVNDKSIQAVVVSTPNKFLKEISLRALEEDKHVLCEKPLGKNAKEAEEIYRRAKEKKRVLKTGFNHRHHPAIFEAKRLLDRGEIGYIYYIRCLYGHGGRLGYEKEWRASKDLCGGGELFDQGVHVVDLFRWFLGEFDEAYGTINTYYWNMEVEDNAFSIFKTKKGQTALMHTSWTQWKNRFLFEIFGEKGYLIVDGLGGSYGIEKLIIGRRKIEKIEESLEESLKQGSQQQRRYLGGSPDEEILEFSGPDTSWEEEWKEFISAIKENREPLGSGYDGLMANKMIEAVYKSARLNRPVKII